MSFAVNQEKQADDLGKEEDLENQLELGQV